MAVSGASLAEIDDDANARANTALLIQFSTSIGLFIAASLLLGSIAFCSKSKAPQISLGDRAVYAWSVLYTVMVMIISDNCLKFLDCTKDPNVQGQYLLESKQRIICYKFDQISNPSLSSSDGSFLWLVIAAISLLTLLTVALIIPYFIRQSLHRAHKTGMIATSTCVHVYTTDSGTQARLPRCAC